MPVIEKDVDGPSSLPLRLDAELPNLGKFSATRRVARAIYLGSAPLSQAAHRGVEDRQVKLGCVMPGESPSVFGDALRRLSGAATYLYQDGPRYWYSTQPTVTKLAEDRAEQLKRDPDKVAQELEKRLKANLRQQGEFTRIHAMPRSGQEVPDDRDARLVVLGSDYPYSKEVGNPAEAAAKAILESRGNAPRLCRNTLVFLAADKTRLQDLDDATRRFLAWDSILNEKVELNLDPQQVKQAETQHNAADGTVTARIPETYQWLLVPVQTSPQTAITWDALRLTGPDALAVRASKKLKSDEYLVTTFAATRLRMELDKIPALARRPRRGEAARRGLQSLHLPAPAQGSVGPPRGDSRRRRVAHLADRRLRLRRQLRRSCPAVSRPSRRPESRPAGRRRAGLLVKPEVARRQLDVEVVKPPPVQPVYGTSYGNGNVPTSVTIDEGPSVIVDRGPVPIELKRFHGTVVLDTTRVGRDASRIADEVIAHLSGLVGARVRVTLEVEADIPSGAPDNVVRTVTENGRTLRFTNLGFEKE